MAWRLGGLLVGPGGLLVGLGLSLVSDTSDGPGQQEVMLFRTKKQFATNPENFKARRTGFWASRHGWGRGGRAGKILVGGLGEGIFGEEISAPLAPLGPRQILTVVGKRQKLRWVP